MKIDIAIAKSCRTIRWKNTVSEWSAIVKKLTNTTRTAETIKQYFAYSKDKQDEIKDVGGFVGGKLLPGTCLIKGKPVTYSAPFGWRRNGFVEHRQLVALDVDYGNFDTWLDFRNLGALGLVYTTHKHQPEEPRFRIVFPLDRPVSPEEYECIARVVASWLGMENFDDTTYQPVRLMYYPSTSKDGEFIAEVSEGEPLIADEVLDTLEGWTNPDTWPRSSREKEIHRKVADKAEDPEEKTGTVGAFCRAFPIAACIAEFLPEVYVPCDELGADRYSFIGGSTSGGLVVYNDKHVYSHHNTDPAGGRLLNSFDLVRLHKFGELDSKAKEDTEMSKLPSYRAMVEFANGLKPVRRELVNERRQHAADDYDDLENKARTVGEQDEWQGELETEGRDGVISQTIDNAVRILANDNLLIGCFGFNDFEKREMIMKATPWDKRGLHYPRPWVDHDDAEIRLYLEKCYGITHVGKITDACTVVVRANTFHPIKQYLDACVWDGEARLDTLLIDALGAQDTKYVRAVTRKWFVAAVARVYRPGTKFDYVLAPIGEQGTGKSTLFARMGMQWYSDSISSVVGKEAAESLQGTWLGEMGEMVALKRAEVEAAKLFISKTEDRYRVAYGKRLEYFPRQCVFAAPTNEDDFLKDVTGNRRFWVVNCKGGNAELPPWDYLDDYVVSQLWAEAKQCLADGETLHLDKVMEEVARDVQDDHLEKDERVGLILEYLNRALPTKWEEMEPYERAEWMREDAKGTETRDKVCVLEIWCECLGKSAENITRRDSLDIGRALRGIRGWRAEGAERIKWYGVQKVYRRKQ